jgi:hypothetical protein
MTAGTAGMTGPRARSQEKRPTSTTDCGASAEHAFLEVRLHANDRELINAGREALDEVLAVHRSEDHDEVNRLGDEARWRIDHFVEIASAEFSSRGLEPSVRASGFTASDTRGR